MDEILGEASWEEGHACPMVQASLAKGKTVTTFRPLNHNVLVKPDPLVKKSKGGLWLPDSRVDRKNELRTGTLLAVGNGMHTVDGGRWPMPDGKGILPNAIGRTVFYYLAEGTVTELDIDGVRHHVLNHDGLDAFVREDGVVQPLHDRILVRRNRAEERSRGGLVIPDTAKERPLFGEVIAIGQAKIMTSARSRPLEVTLGDIVMFSAYSGVTMPEDENTIMMREADVIAITGHAITKALLESQPAMGMGGA
jgi:chaperonin GroES